MKLSPMTQLVSLFAVAHLALVGCGGAVEQEDAPESEVESQTHALASCPNDTVTCEPCGGGLYRQKSVDWTTIYDGMGGISCYSRTTYGTCQQHCAF